MTRIDHLTGVEKQIFLTNKITSFLECLDQPQEFVTLCKEPGLITLTFVEGENISDYDCRMYKLWQKFANMLSIHFIKANYSKVQCSFYDCKIEISIVEEL